MQGERERMNCEIWRITSLMGDRDLKVNGAAFQIKFVRTVLSLSHYTPHDLNLYVIKYFI